MKSKSGKDMRIYPKKRLIPKKKPPTFVLFPYELIAKQKETMREKEAESLMLIVNHLKEFKRPFVSTSHGKDSVVMCHLVIRACNQLDIEYPEFFLNHTLNIFKEEPEYWKLINKFLGIEDRFKVFYPDKNEETNKPWTVWTIAEKYGHLPNFRTFGKKGEKGTARSTPECCNILKKDHENKYLKKIPRIERYDLQFIGTQAAESNIRQLNVMQRCRSYATRFKKPYVIQKCTPLSFWKDDDIWAYFDAYNIPRNPVYAIHDKQRMGCASCPAYKFWELDQIKDPTKDGLRMLELNMQILKKTEIDRYEASIQTLTRYIKKKTTSEEIRQKTLLLFERLDKYIPPVKDVDSIKWTKH